MGTPTTILLVDDDIKNLVVLETILESPDYRLIKAGGADEALLALMHEDCAAIVMDVRMPGMSGIELAHLIKQRRKTRLIPILFLTAHYYADEQIVLGYDAGAVDYLTKPVNPAILRSKVAVFVELFRKTAELEELNEAMQSEIQDRKKAEEQFRLVVESAPNGMIVVDEHENIILVNSRMEAIFGFTREELMGKRMETLVPRTMLPDKIKRMQFQEEAPPQELSGLRKDGSIVSIEAIFVHYESADGLFELVSFADITRRKNNERTLREAYVQLESQNIELQRASRDRELLVRAEAAQAEAEAANNAKDRFLAMLSHELRTPLSPVLHAVTLIQEENICPPPMIELLDIIRRNVQLEARLIDDLLDIARIRNNKLQLHLEWADANDLLRRAFEICEHDITERKLQVKLDLASQHSLMEVDSARIQQIFWNLITNAVKYSGPGATMSISTYDDEKTGFFCAQVRDTGIGIDPTRLDGIFNAFEQAHGNRSKGLGLGLAISRVLAELHGGTIAASSDGDGKGSVFTLRLPKADQQRFQSRSPASGSAAVSPLRVLLVEDHVDTAMSLERLLKNLGHSVVSCATCSAALKACEEHTFDLLLSDIGLPDGNGWDLMQPFLKAAQDRPVTGIALSGFGTSEDVEKSRAAGFHRHLIKPITYALLQSCLLECATRIESASKAGVLQIE